MPLIKIAVLGRFFGRFPRRDHIITAEQALRAADSENDVRLAIKLHSSGSRAGKRQVFDVEAPTGTHIDKWWKDQ